MSCHTPGLEIKCFWAQLHLQNLPKGVVYRKQYIFGLPADIWGSRKRIEGSPGLPENLISSPALSVPLSCLILLNVNDLLEWTETFTWYLMHFLLLSEFERWRQPRSVPCSESQARSCGHIPCTQSSWVGRSCVSIVRPSSRMSCNSSSTRSPQSAVTPSAAIAPVSCWTSTNHASWISKRCGYKRHRLSFQEDASQEGMDGKLYL